MGNGGRRRNMARGADTSNRIWRVAVWVTSRWKEIRYKRGVGGRMIHRDVIIING